MRRPHLSRLTPLLLCAALLPLAAAADEEFYRMRPGPIIGESPAPVLAIPKKDERRGRAYPEQPPTIPHSIDGYETSLRANQCLSCHSRRRAAETGAPMVSVSHFTGRDFQVLSDISPRRYFCLQCHVQQTGASPPVDNEFIDAADLPGEGE